MRGFSVAAQLAAAAAFVACLGACAPAPGGNARATPPPGPSMDPAARQLPSPPLTAPRALPRRLYGVTVDDVSNVSQIVASSRNLPETPVTRIYLDVAQPVGYYKTAISELHPVSYLMGELLDSSDQPHISHAAFSERVKSFLAAYGDQIDIWEIGNEVNGNWTGPYSGRRGQADHRLPGRDGPPRAHRPDALLQRGMRRRACRARPRSPSPASLSRQRSQPG